MTDDAKQTAWDRFCTECDKLGIDPFSPDVPEDHPGLEQYKIIKAEYDDATTIKQALPPDWEGHPPVDDVDALEGLASWLGFQWNLVKGGELAGDSAKAGTIRDAVKAIRNAFRVLAWLGVDDKPNRPLPPSSLDECKQQIDHLQRWVLEKHKSGWKPKENGNADAASPRQPTAKRSVGNSCSGLVFGF